MADEIQAQAGCNVTREVTFRFHTNLSREALKLSGPPPYMHPEGRARVNAALATGCRCQHDGARTGTLRRRLTASGSLSVWLQCDACGSSLGGAMSRQLHPGWEAYAPWDQAAADAYDTAYRAYIEAHPSWEDKKREREVEYTQRSHEYELWCRTSPEWAALIKRVAWRSRGHCEACLNGTAEVIHHLTYEFGKLPPAWHLRAVCRGCHDRLHSRGDDWCDYGMARG